MDNQEVMYMVVDELAHWVYMIEAKLEDAVETARLMNQEENPMYHHYVVVECSAEYAAEWYEAWKKVMNL